MNDSLALPGSKDPVSGEVYVPPRRHAADGSLRECQPVEVPAKGVLASWTSYNGEFFGLVDLAHAVRIQARLGEGPHEVGSVYVGVRGAFGVVRFDRD
jgi:uncharacterized OB-fold protein